MLLITPEDLLKIEKTINDKHVNACVGVERGELFLRVSFKDRHYQELITEFMARNEPKQLIIDRFAHFANKYING